MFFRGEGETAFTDEPSLFFGFAPRFAGEVHVHLNKSPGEHFTYEAVAPAMHFQITPPDKAALWQLAAAAEYEIARHSDDNNLAVRLIAAHTFGEGSLTLNAIGERSRAEGTHAGYAAGFRPDMEAQVSWGIEAQGRVKRDEQQELLFGVYTQPATRLTVKMGAGVGYGVGKPAVIVRTGFVWHF